MEQMKQDFCSRYWNERISTERVGEIDISKTWNMKYEISNLIELVLLVSKKFIIVYHILLSYCLTFGYIVRIPPNFVALRWIWTCKFVIWYFKFVRAWYQKKICLLREFWFWLKFVYVLILLKSFFKKLNSISKDLVVYILNIISFENISIIDWWK